MRSFIYLFFSRFNYSKGHGICAFLLPEILSFQGSAHLLGVGSFSYLLDKLSVLANEPDIQEVQPGNEEDLNNIYIFGAGMYGRQLKANLSGQGIELAGFLDNDAGKWGRSIDGLKCFSPEILKEKAFARITVAMQDPAEVEKQLKKLQGIETIPYQKIQYQMFMHCPSNRCLQDFVRQEEAGRSR